MYRIEDLQALEEFKEIPQWYWDELPKVCPECGEPTVSDIAMTDIRCCNPYCRGKVVVRCKRMLDDLGVKGLGESGIGKCVDEEGVRNPFYIIMLARGEEENQAGLGNWSKPYKIYRGINEELNSKICQQIKQAVQRKLSIAEVVTMLHLDGLGEGSCRDLFKGVEYEEVEAFFEKVAEGKGVEWVAERLGIVGSEVRAMSIRGTMMMYQEDIQDAISVVRDYLKGDNSTKGVVRLKGCYSDKVATKYGKTKKEFYNYIADKYPEVEIEWMSSVTKECEFLVSGTGEETGKMRKAEKYGIPVFGTRDEAEAEDEFIEWMQGKMSKGEE